MLIPIYKKLPENTPRWLVIAIFLLGGGLGLSISVQALLALYGLGGFLTNLFFPSSGFHIESHEAIYLGILGIFAALSATIISYLAVYMNGLSKKSLAYSRVVWIPTLFTSILVLMDYFCTNFQYNFSLIWVLGSFLSVILAGVFPWLLLRTRAGRKIHNH